MINPVRLVIELIVLWLSILSSLKMCLLEENPLLWKIFGWKFKNEGSPEDLQGPEYKLFVPERKLSLVEDQRNKPIITFSGRVTDLNGNPLSPPPKLDIWHPDHKGFYSILGYDCRGIITCDKDGYFKVETALPRHITVASIIGHDWLIKDKPTARVRPSHFHIIITHKGKRVLCTQIYLEKDAVDKVHEIFGFTVCPTNQMATVVTHQPDSLHSLPYYTAAYNFTVKPVHSKTQ